MKILIFGLLALICATCHAFSCLDPKIIHDKPIQFNQERIQLTQKYQRSHYGIKGPSIEIEPKMIVLHWTCLPTLALAFKVFDPPQFPQHSPRRAELPDDLNVSAHFVVDRDGSIYRLMPETWMARHVIGLNHYAIGIENVGGIDGKDDLTQQQVESNAYLVCYLKKKYKTIEQVIGHNEYLGFQNNALWLEKDPKYVKDKTDPGPHFVKKVLRMAV